MTDQDFEKLKDKVTPYFVKFWGEEYRDIVEERLNNVVPIFYDTFESQKQKLYNEIDRIKTQLAFKFLAHFNLKIPDDVRDDFIKNGSLYNVDERIKNILKLCFDGSKYSNSDFSLIKNIEMYNLRQIDLNCKALYLLGINVDKKEYESWINTFESNYTIKLLSDMKEFVCKLDKEYIEISSMYKELEDYILNKECKVVTEISDKYERKFIQWLNEEKILNKINVGENDLLNIVGLKLYANGLIDSFTSSTCQKLNSGDLSGYSRECIIDNKIKYYKLIGVYNDTMDKEEFLNSDLCEKYKISTDIADKVVNKRNELYNEYKKEYYMATSTYEENKKKIDALDLDDYDGFFVDYIINKEKCISTAAKKYNDHYKCIPILIFSEDSCLKDYKDVTIVHELNHAIELNIINSDNDDIVYKCGFDIMSNKTNNNLEKRNYEMMNEIINQIIAMEITEMMHNDGVYLLDDSKNSKIKHSTSYEWLIPVVINFYNSFKKEIKDARINNSMDTLFNTVGIDNFEKLNNLVKEYWNMPYYQVMYDINNKNETSLTKKFYDLINRFTENYNLMLNYSIINREGKDIQNGQIIKN